MKHLSDVLNIHNISEFAIIVNSARNALPHSICGIDFIRLMQNCYREILNNEEIKNKFYKLYPNSRNVSEWSNFRELFNPSVWEKKFFHELPLNRALDRRQEDTETEAIRAYRPLGVVLHICPGNSFLGGIDSLLHGIATGNRNIVRISKQTPPILNLVTNLLISHGLPAEQATIVYWPSGSVELEKEIVKKCDGLILWGSNELIQYYRSITPAGIKLIEYGARFSFSLATEDFINLSSDHSRRSLKGIVHDVCAYDQVSCSNSQALFLLGNKNNHQQFMMDLSEEFAKYSIVDPPTNRTKHSQIEFLKELERVRIEAAHENCHFINGYPNWLLVYKKKFVEVTPSPLFRTLHIYPVSSMEELKSLLLPIKRYLQTASVLSTVQEWPEITERLWELGVNRVVEQGQSLIAVSGSPHDGSHILQELVRVVSQESDSNRKHLWLDSGPDETLQKLKKHLKRCSSSFFYQQKLKNSQIIDIEKLTWKDFQNIAWTVKADFFKYGPPNSSDMLTKKFEDVHGAYLFTTGGSTGEPKYALYNRVEWEEICDIFASEFQRLGLSYKDRVANLFTGGGLWSAFIATTEGLEKLGCLNFPVGGNMEHNQVLDVMQNFNINAVFGLPTTLLKLAQYAKNNDRNIQIKKILYAGEHLNQEAKKFIQETFQADFVRSGTYASVDAGCIGYQCEHAEGSIHHVLEQYCYLEICDPETKKQVAPGEEGEIIVTNLSRILFPVIRLRTGDRGRIITKTCQCGTTATTFELLGRNDDQFRVSGANIFLSDIEKICTLNKTDLSYLYQVTVSQIELDEVLHIKIEALKEHNESDLKLLSEKIKMHFLSIADDLRLYYQSGYLKHFDLKIVNPGIIPQSTKTGKTKHLIDLRQINTEL